MLIGNGTGPGLPGENGGKDGGIYNAGLLLIQGSQIEDNFTGSGGDGITVDCWGMSGGNGGQGGGIFNSGSLTVIQTNIIGNITGTGSAGGGIRDWDWWCHEGYPGVGGGGGGIFSTNTLYIKDSKI